MPFPLSRRQLAAVFILSAGILAAGEAKKAGKPAPTPEQLLATVKVQPGFTATLFASPPDVGYPTGVAAAPNSELYVAIDENGSLGHDPNRGRIVRCVDADGDGKAEKFILFAKVDSPRGLIYTGDKLFVLHPPMLSMYPIKPDGSAGEPELLVKGMGGGREHPRGADHTTNQIQMGIDGWIYIAAGDFGFFKAVGKDGKEFQYPCGGVVRVRPDGTEMEAVSRGQRNIYDVAIDPLMNLFTRDNTNDGGGWDVRLSHVIPSGNYGYPSQFKNFGEEIVQPLAVYGGGSPCGSLFLDEPGLPPEFGHALYTVEWGLNGVFRHPMEIAGAGYKVALVEKDGKPKPEQRTFVEVPHPTDMDVDGQGKLYIASWRDGGFSYSHPHVGYIARVTCNASKPAPFPDLKKASDEQLLEHLASPSHTCRLHTQYEILRRGKKPIFADGLEKLALGDKPPAVRVAAIFTLKQLQGAGASQALTRIAANEKVKEFALRALADRKSETANAPAQPFLDALKSADPRVRLQAAFGLGRLGKPELGEQLIPLVADADPLVAHVAVNSLVTLRAIEPCLQALDKSSPNVHPGCLRALHALHDPKTVSGLIERLNKSPALKQPILKALCRLYFKEADWDGKWWSTKPDTSGPYYKTASWEQTERIKDVLQKALASADGETLAFLVVNLQRHKIDIGDAIAKMVKIAEQDAATRATVVDLLAGRSSVPAEAVPLLEKTALNEKDDAALRVKALKALQTANAMDAIVRSLASFGAKAELARAREEFIRDGNRSKDVAYFSKLADSEDTAKRELACAVLVQVAGNKKASKEKDAASRAVDECWKKPGVASLLQAVGQTRADGYADKIRQFLKDARPEVQSAAAFAAKQLKIDDKGATAPSGPLIGKLPHEQVVATAMKAKGDANTGAQLFLKQRCNTCHTVADGEAPKGPPLLGIGTRYNRAELLESILKPSAKISQGFASQLIKLKDGRRFEGFVVREAAEEIEIRNGAGESSLLPAKDIEKRATLETSIMPNGIADNLTVEELAALIAYLESLKGK